ncbi:MAG: TetR/AcrR family transcriptional regulator [Acidimicrobiales bacterium]
MSRDAVMDDVDAAAAVLDTAGPLFYRHGVAAVSMAMIRDRSGVSMRRLYGLYPSKADLVAAWLEQLHLRWMGGFTKRADDRLRRGESVADAVFGALADWMTETDFRGCGFINTHAESNGLTEEHHRTIRRHKRVLSEYLQSLTPSGAALAVLLDGAIVQASIFGDVTYVNRARWAAASIVDGGQAMIQPPSTFKV